jgi:NAD(P)-dependent dehydrogenase (short-subunit alcohol dehydrogenase family)
MTSSVAIVTGASQGIGHSTAVRLARDHCADLRITLQKSARVNCGSLSARTSAQLRGGGAGAPHATCTVSTWPLTVPVPCTIWQSAELG